MKRSILSGRVLLLLSLLSALVAGHLAYTDLIRYWLGFSGSNIVRLDLTQHTLLHEVGFQKKIETWSKHGVQNSHKVTKMATGYETPEGKRIYVYHTTLNAKPNVFIYQPKDQVLHEGEQITIVSYDPFVLWYEIVVRSPIFLVALVLLFLMNVGIAYYVSKGGEYLRWRSCSSRFR